MDLVVGLVAVGADHLAVLEARQDVGEGDLEIDLDQGTLGLGDRNSLVVAGHKEGSQDRDQRLLVEVARILVRTAAGN